MRKGSLWRMPCLAIVCIWCVRWCVGGTLVGSFVMSASDDSWASGPFLKDGVRYTVFASGCYSVWEYEAFANICQGAEYFDGYSADAVYLYTVPSVSPTACSTAVPKPRTTYFKLSESSTVHISDLCRDPYNQGHLYKFEVEGKGSVCAARIQDTFFEGNYGCLYFDIIEEPCVYIYPLTNATVKAETDWQYDKKKTDSELGCYRTQYFQDQVVGLPVYVTNDCEITLDIKMIASKGLCHETEIVVGSVHATYPAGRTKVNFEWGTLESVPYGIYDLRVIAQQSSSITNYDTKWLTGQRSVQVCRGNPVILVHGINGDASGWGDMEWLLEHSNNFAVVNYDYHGMTASYSSPYSIENIAAAFSGRSSVFTNYWTNSIAYAKSYFGRDSVDVVAHSMGGLVSRAYMAGMADDETASFLYQGEIDKVVTLGSPFYGRGFLTSFGYPLSLMKSLLGWLGVDSWPKRQLDEMTLGSDFMWEFHSRSVSYDKHLALAGEAGDTTLEDGRRLVSDGVVEIASAAVVTRSEVAAVLPDYLHSKIPGSYGLAFVEKQTASNHLGYKLTSEYLIQGQIDRNQKGVRTPESYSIEQTPVMVWTRSNDNGPANATVKCWNSTVPSTTSSVDLVSTLGIHANNFIPSGAATFEIKPTGLSSWRYEPELVSPVNLVPNRLLRFDVVAGDGLSAQHTSLIGKLAAEMSSEVISVVLRPAVDSDLDGLTDSFTEKFFGHLAGLAQDLSRPGDDPDHDGLPNLWEQYMGYDPTNPNETFGVSTVSVATNGSVQVVSDAVPGILYQLQWSQSGVGSWVNICPPTQGTGAACTFEGGNPGASGYCRLWAYLVPEEGNATNVTYGVATPAAAIYSCVAPLGTPEWWLQSIGYTNNFAAAELVDKDGDGVANYLEYKYCTDPLDASSRPSFNNVPYAESFEELSGWGGAYTNVSPLMGWYGGPSDRSRIVSSAYTYAATNLPLLKASHTNALQVDTRGDVLTNLFQAAHSDVSPVTYVDLMLQPVPNYGLPINPAAEDPDVRCAVYADMSNHLAVYHGVAASDGSWLSNAVTVTETLLDPENWHRLTIAMDSTFTNSAMFRVLVDGLCVMSASAHPEGWKEALAASGAMPPVGPNGSWFREAKPTVGTERLRAMELSGTWLLDDLVVATNDPYASPVADMFLLCVSLTGNGRSSLGSLLYRSVFVPTGYSTQIVYKADDWNRVYTLLKNGEPVAGAAGRRVYTQDIACVSSDVSNSVTFSKAAQEQTGYMGVPTSWLMNWGEDDVAAGDDDAFGVAAEYLLGLSPVAANTYGLMIESAGLVDGNFVTVVRRDVTGALSPGGINGHLALKAAGDLGGTFTNIAGTAVTGTNAFDISGRRAYTNDIGGLKSFFRAVIE